MFDYLSYLEGKTGKFLPENHPLKQGLLEIKIAAKIEEKKVAIRNST